MRHSLVLQARSDHSARGLKVAKRHECSMLNIQSGLNVQRRTFSLGSDIQPEINVTGVGGGGAECSMSSIQTDLNVLSNIPSGLNVSILNISTEAIYNSVFVYETMIFIDLFAFY